MSVQTTNLKFKSAPPKAPKRGRFLRVLIWIAVLGVFALGFYLVSMPKEAPKGRIGPPTAITTTTAKTGSIGVYLDAIGTVTPVYTASIFSQVTGVVVGVNYQEGQLVKRGDPLVDIDPARYQAAVTQAEGQLARDQAQLELAKVNLVRDTDLLNRGVISRQDYDAQVATDHQFQGTVMLDQGNLDQAKVNLSYCHIAAPFTGRVGLRLVDPGNLVTANASTSSSSNPLVVLTQLQTITVVFTIA